ncbi:hypothetical protein BKA62DRAFT_703690 [Auriculariales sp. MPI-PUGE-AT-0066]|nr:hypothetical protein BKA62DRAFT_703690 [Auriculariales sp. MPI-PUGE-AT-0066]
MPRPDLNQRFNAYLGPIIKLTALILPTRAVLARRVREKQKREQDNRRNPCRETDGFFWHVLPPGTLGSVILPTFSSQANCTVWVAEAQVLVRNASTCAQRYVKGSKMRSKFPFPLPWDFLAFERVYQCQACLHSLYRRYELFPLLRMDSSPAIRFRTGNSSRQTTRLRTSRSLPRSAIDAFSI